MQADELAERDDRGNGSDDGRNDGVNDVVNGDGGGGGGTEPSASQPAPSAGAAAPEPPSSLPADGAERGRSPAADADADAVVSGRVSTLERLAGVLDALFVDPGAAVFRTPVPPHEVGGREAYNQRYLPAVQFRPVDLGTVRSRLFADAVRCGAPALTVDGKRAGDTAGAAGSGCSVASPPPDSSSSSASSSSAAVALHYAAHPSNFEADVRRVFVNALAFNEPAEASPVAEAARRLLDKFDARYVSEAERQARKAQQWVATYVVGDRVDAVRVATDRWNPATVVDITDGRLLLQYDRLPIGAMEWVDPRTLRVAKIGSRVRRKHTGTLVEHSVRPERTFRDDASDDAGGGAGGGDGGGARDSQGRELEELLRLRTAHDEDDTGAKRRVPVVVPAATGATDAEHEERRRDDEGADQARRMHDVRDRGAVNRPEGVQDVEAAEADEEEEDERRRQEAMEKRRREAEEQERRRRLRSRVMNDDLEDVQERDSLFLRHVPLSASGLGATGDIPLPVLRVMRRNAYGDSYAAAAAHTVGLGAKLAVGSAAAAARHLTGGWRWRGSERAASIRRIAARRINEELNIVEYWCRVAAAGTRGRGSEERDEDNGPSPPASAVGAVPSEEQAAERRVERRAERSWRWLSRKTLLRLRPELVAAFDARHPEPPHLPELETARAAGVVPYTRLVRDPRLVDLPLNVDAAGATNGAVGAQMGVDANEGEGERKALRLEIYPSHVEVRACDVDVRPYRPTLHIAGRVMPLAAGAASGMVAKANAPNAVVPGKRPLETSFSSSSVTTHARGDARDADAGSGTNWDELKRRLAAVNR